MNKSQFIDSIFSNVISGLIGSFIMLLLSLLFKIDYNNLFRYFKSIWYWKSEIRISCAYLFVIEKDGKYLLVRNSKRDSFQLPGGVYKYDKRASVHLERMKFSQDRFLEINEKSRSDLRLHIKGRYLANFIKWFESQKDREVSHSREFYEELVKPKVLSLEKFPFPTYIFRKKYYSPLKRHDYFNGIPQLLVFDLLELIPNEKQSEELEKLLKNGDTNDIKWATPELIENLGYDHFSKTEKYRIGDHTKEAINYLKQP